MNITGKLLLTLFFAVILTAALSVIAVVTVILLNKELLNNLDLTLHDPTFMKFATWAQILGFIGAVCIIYILFERKKDSLHTVKLGLKGSAPLSRFAEGLLAGVILITVSCGFIWALGGVKLLRMEWNAQVVCELLGGALLFAGVSFNEELLTRGYLQGLIRSRYGAITAISLTSSVFALMHAFNPGIWNSPLPFLNLLLAGALFGVAREVSGGLWMPIGMHLSWNFFQGHVYGFLVSGTSVESVIRVEQAGSSYISGGAFGAEGSVITSLVVMAGIVLIYKYYQAKKKNTIARREYI